MQSYSEPRAQEAEIATQAIREELARNGRAAVIAVADSHGDLSASFASTGHLSPRS